MPEAVAAVVPDTVGESVTNQLPSKEVKPIEDSNKTATDKGIVMADVVSSEDAKSCEHTPKKNSESAEEVKVESTSGENKEAISESPTEEGKTEVDSADQSKQVSSDQSKTDDQIVPNSSEKDAPNSSEKDAPDSSEKDAPNSLEKGVSDSSEKDVPNSSGNDAPDSSENVVPDSSEKDAPDSSGINLDEKKEVIETTTSVAENDSVVSQSNEDVKKAESVDTQESNMEVTESCPVKVKTEEKNETIEKTEEEPSSSAEVNNQADEKTANGTAATEITENKNKVNSSISEEDLESAGPSTLGRPEKIDAKAAENLELQVKEGKAKLDAADFLSAADILGRACEESNKVYGEVANESGELYYLYGCAMLECYKKESDILGEAIKQKEAEQSSNTEGDDDMETEENQEDGEEQMCVDGEGKEESPSEKKEVEVKENGVSKVNEDDKMESEDEKKENGDVKENGNSEETVDDKEDPETCPNDEPMAVEEDAESGSNVLSQSEEGDDEEESLKTAWQMFELSKIVFNRTENHSRHADTYIKLAEVGIETGHVEALTDIKLALKLRLGFFPENLRLLSETYFTLGLGYATFEQFNEAIENFQLAKDHLEKKIKNLSNLKEDTKAEEEIKELKGLLPELDEKISDMKASLEGKTKPTVNLDQSEKVGESSKPVSNISHLVKRKRKLEDVTSELPCSKQKCTEKTPEKIVTES